MIRVAISVEGQTESEFCSQVLTPFLYNYNISIDPIIVSTSKDIKTGKKHKGGSINMDRIRNEIKRLLPNYDYVTTFYDSPQTVPSKRIKKIFKDSNEKYNKIFHGVNILMDIGIETIRSKSKKFNNRINKLIDLR